MKAYDELTNFQSQASELLRDDSWTQMRQHGLGPNYSNDFVRTKLNAARPQIMQQVDAVSSQLSNSGLEFTGLQGRAEAEGISALAGVGQSAELEAWKQNEAVKSNVRQTDLNVAMHDDNLRLQQVQTRAQLDAAEASWADYALGGMSLVTAFL